MTRNNLLKEGRNVLRQEAHAILSTAQSLGTAFTQTLELLFALKGKIIISGIGKSGILGKRMASVFSSTGTPAFFMHPTEGVHGDIGIISKNDVILLISHSGKSEELLTLIPHIKRHGIKIITLTQYKKCPLARFADIALETHVKKEACPFNLVPTTSSTVTAAIGDALAITLLKLKGFERKDYKLRHPGGAIGKKLLYRVEDLMKSGMELPSVSDSGTLKNAIEEMSKKKLGMTCVLNKQGRLVGILTDGDLRRLLEKNKADLQAPVKQLLSGKTPKTIVRSMLAIEALSIMEENSITSLIIVDNASERKVIGVIHMHNILKAGVV